MRGMFLRVWDAFRLRHQENARARWELAEKRGQEHLARQRAGIRDVPPGPGS